MVWAGGVALNFKEPSLPMRGRGGPLRLWVSCAASAFGALRAEVAGESDVRVVFALLDDRIEE